jgi:acetyl esterase/lipase
MLVSLYIATTLTAQDKGKSGRPVPSTISHEAQEFLRNAQPIPPAPQNLDEWKALQEQTEEKESPRSQKALDALAKKLEVRKMGGVDVHIITPNRLDPAHADKALIDIHGGGYCTYTCKSTYFVTATLADVTGLRVYSIDYRLAPQHPFPAGLNDCVSAYRQIIKEVAPKRIGMFGISAGGSMILAVVLKARDEGLPMPGALASITPAGDWTGAGDSRNTIDGLDPVLTSKNMPAFAKAYAGSADLRNPLVSPVYADYSKGFPPTIIQTGTRDLLLSDCVRLNRALKDNGVDVELSVWEGMWHGFQVIPNTSSPESKAAFAELARFFDKKLKQRGQ